MQELGIPVVHSRQEISKFCTLTGVRIGIGWGNMPLLKKCLKLMRFFLVFLSMWFLQVICLYHLFFLFTII